jgi:hypothetical protein
MTEGTVGKLLARIVSDVGTKGSANAELTELFATLTGATGPLLEGGSTVEIIDVVEFTKIVGLTIMELLAWRVVSTLTTVTETPDTGAGAAAHCCCVTAVPHVHWRIDGQLDCGPEISGVAT